MNPETSENKGTVNSFKKQVVDGLEDLETYKDTIHEISMKLMKIDWFKEYKVFSNDVEALHRGLRDAILNIEELGKRAVGKRINLEIILENLNAASNELYRARRLAQGNGIQADSSGNEQEDKHDKVRKCRQYIKLAEDLMVFRRKSN